MKKLSTAAGIAALLITGAAHAHAHLKLRIPRRARCWAPTATSISLTFSESARITALFLQKDQEATQTLEAPTATGETIGVALPTLKRARIP